MHLEGEQSSRALDAYFDQAADEDDLDRRLELVYGAIQAIIDGHWYQLYDHWDEMTWPGAVVMGLAGSTVMVWRINVEEPGKLRVVWIGDL